MSWTRVGGIVVPRHVRFDSGRRCSSSETDREPLQEITVKRTFQPNNRRRSKKHGFRARMADRAGRKVIRSRRLKGRNKLSA